MRLLAIEDDKKIIDNLAVILKIAWPHIQFFSARRADTGMQMFNECNADILLLDIGLPDASGLDILKQIRRTSNTPIIILSALGEEKDVVLGLELGANDYVSKPFRQMELIARIRKLTRNDVQSDANTSARSNNLRFGSTIRQLFYQDQEISLTRNEGRLVNKLLQEVNKAVTYESLSMAIWGDYHISMRPSLKVYVKNIRNKFARVGIRDNLIINIPQIGYMLVDERK